MNTTSLTASAAGSIESDRSRAILIAAFLGFGLIFLTGFASADVLHNAAHDFRHVQNYPCH